MPKAAPAARRRAARDKRRPTIVDVARAASVVQSTVSLYLRDPDRVSEARRAKIAKAIDELGYVRHAPASSLAGGHAPLVYVFVPSISTEVFGQTVETIQMDLLDAGYQIMVGATQYDPQLESRLMQAAHGWAPAAVVATGLDHAEQARRILARARYPTIEMWDIGPDPIDTCVGFSHDLVGARMFEHLYAAGARSFCFLGARLETDGRAARRAKAFVKAARRRGLRADILESAGSVGAPFVGGVLASAAFDARPRYDGIACSSDLIALGALFEAQRRAIDVPGRVKILGFGGFGFGAAAIPAISTVAPPAREIGKVVAREVLGRLRGERRPQRMFDLGFDVIRRGTT